MPVYRAPWVLPIDTPPIRDGWVAIERGCIAGVGSGQTSGAIDLGRVAVLPALVNAHTHLELSYMRGRVPPADRFLDWIGAIMTARRQWSDPRDPRSPGRARRNRGSPRAARAWSAMSAIARDRPLLRDAAMAARVFYDLSVQRR